jgi:hypothetical protein
MVGYLNLMMLPTRMPKFKVRMYIFENTPPPPKKNAQGEIPGNVIWGRGGYEKGERIKRKM